MCIDRLSRCGRTFECVSGNIHIVPYIEKIHNKNDGGVRKHEKQKMVIGSSINKR